MRLVRGSVCNRNDVGKYIKASEKLEHVLCARNSFSGLMFIAVIDERPRRMTATLIEDQQHSRGRIEIEEIVN